MPIPLVLFRGVFYWVQFLFRSRHSVQHKMPDRIRSTLFRFYLFVARIGKHLLQFFSIELVFPVVARQFVLLAFGCRQFFVSTLPPAFREWLARWWFRWCGFADVLIWGVADYNLRCYGYTRLRLAKISLDFPANYRTPNSVVVSFRHRPLGYRLCRRGCFPFGLARRHCVLALAHFVAYRFLYDAQFVRRYFRTDLFLLVFF